MVKKEGKIDRQTDGNDGQMTSHLLNVLYFYWTDEHGNKSDNKYVKHWKLRQL